MIRLASSRFIMTPENTPPQAFMSHENKCMLSKKSLNICAIFTVKTRLPYGVRKSVDSPLVSGSTFPPEAVVSGLFINT